MNNFYGLKPTHDANLAKISDGKLEWVFEVEKFNNNERHSDLYTWDDFECLFMERPDTLIVDGWGNPETKFVSEDETIKLTMGSYISQKTFFKSSAPKVLDVGKLIEYKSYSHVTNHVTGSYCGSPFAPEEETFVSVWDGGVLACLYHVDGKRRKFTYLGKFMPVSGRVFTEVSNFFKPFHNKKNLEKHLNVVEQADIVSEGVYKTKRGYHIGINRPGTLMAYCALGQFQQEISDIITDLGEGNSEAQRNSKYDVFEWFECLKDETLHYSDEDIIATFFQHYGNLFVKNLIQKVTESGLKCRNLILTGGCALNIKWNSAVRDTGFFDYVWVPPYANDSGSGIGAACTEMIYLTGNMKLDWDVYCGPYFNNNYRINSEWDRKPCSLKELALFFYEVGEPVVFIKGQAEIGPRALGHRSILAPATCGIMKDCLNQIKGRQSFRPVAPICLEEYAPEYFTPGTPDPYMLFDHKATRKAQIITPAIVHLDNTARLQTINAMQEEEVYELLKEYHQLTGVPLLCNTSANLPGCGFFQDLESIFSWGKVNFVWFEENLYFKLNQ